MGSTALTRDLHIEAREIERVECGWVVGDERRKRGRAALRRAGWEEEQQAETRARGEVESDAAATMRGTVARRTPRVAAMLAEEEARLARRAEAAAGGGEVPMEHGSEEEDETGGEEERGARGAEAEAEDSEWAREDSSEEEEEASEVEEGSSSGAEEEEPGVRRGARLRERQLQEPQQLQRR